MKRFKYINIPTFFRRNVQLKKGEFGRKIGFGVKDAIASGLIAQGVILWNQGSALIASIFMVIGGILFIIDYFAGA